MRLPRLFQRFVRGQRARTVPTYPMNPRLPTIETCTSDGIVGRITSGPNAGEWVLAETYRDPSTGKVDFYSPYLPDEDLYDTHGSFVMSDGVVDVPRPPGVGGLIDELTNALDVEWHADPTCVEQERAAFAARYAQRGSLSPDAQPDRVMAMFREMSGLWLVGESNADELSRAAAMSSPPAGTRPRFVTLRVSTPRQRGGTSDRHSNGPGNSSAARSPRTTTTSSSSRSAHNADDSSPGN
jgi:hypothetical protein